MTRTLRRFAPPLGHALTARPRLVLAAAAATFVAIATPAGADPISLPSLPVSTPDVASPVTVGAVLKAVDTAGRPLATAQFDVYHVDQPDGVQHPILDVPAASGGTVTVPLPAPGTIPDAASNYYAVSTGVTVDGDSVSGIDFFDLTTQNPLATATITPDLFQVPPVTVIGNTPPIGDLPTPPPVPNPTATDTPPVTIYGNNPLDDVPSTPPAVPSPTDSPTVPSVPDLGNLPPISDTPTPLPTGPCGFQPDTEHPPPPAFTITTQTIGDVDGYVDIGAAHGTGSWPGNTFQPDDLNGSPYKAMGELLESDWTRSTESSVVLSLDLNGATQTKYNLAGNTHFTLAESDVREYAGHGGVAKQAGHGARTLVVAATWDHKSITFHCNSGDRKSETHELWMPHNWNPHISTDTPDVTPDNMDSIDAVEGEPGTVVFPMAANQTQPITAGESEVYDNGGWSGTAGTGIADINFDVYSQTTDSATVKTTIYAGGDCGTRDQPTCLYWAVNTAAATNCPWQLACGTDYYTATLAGPSAVPNPEPQPCSKYEPHGQCT